LKRLDICIEGESFKRQSILKHCDLDPGGKYTNTCFQSNGTGQFKPSADSAPHIGNPGQLEQTDEIRVETICVGRKIAENAVKALKDTHPYEEVAYEVYRMEDL
jgi:hypothetical protein